MNNLTFGIEIELTGITRQEAAHIIERHFGTEKIRVNLRYDSWKIDDNKNRVWSVVRDASITPQRIIDRRRIEAGEKYKVEIVSPICTYEDIETVQEIIRKLRQGGAITNKSCGIHIHIGKKVFSPQTLRNLVNIIASKEDLIYRALDVNRNRESRYCKKVDSTLLMRLNKKKPKEFREIENFWYEGSGLASRERHYHSSRYRGLNLHSFFNGDTVEFRFFNSTTHAGKIKAYIQFCLMISNQALKQKSASSRKTNSSNDKYTFRTWLLRLGLIGEEFKTARLHLLANLEGDSAFRNGRTLRRAVGE